MSEINTGQGQLWEVFIQSKPGLPHKHVYTRRQEGTCIWVVPFDAITSSSPEDNGAFFEPNNDKAYRTPTHYVMPEGAKHI